MMVTAERLKWLREAPAKIAMECRDDVHAIKRIIARRWRALSLEMLHRRHLE